MLSHFVRPTPRIFTVNYFLDWDHPCITSAHFWTLADPSTHQPYISVNTTEHMKKLPFFSPYLPSPFADVIERWSPYCLHENYISCFSINLTSQMWNKCRALIYLFVYYYNLFEAWSSLQHVICNFVCLNLNSEKVHKFFDKLAKY